MKVGHVSVGETLSHARRTRGLSVDDISADTRVRASLIASIEADDFGPCGGTVYARGHVRNIAKMVGLDPDEVAHQFDLEQHVEPPAIATTVAAQPTDPVLAARSVHHRPNWNIAMGAALAVICLVAGIGLLAGHGHGNKGPAADAAGTNSTVQPRTTAGNPPPSTSSGSRSSAGTTSTGTVAQQASMSVKALTGNCWIEIKSAKTGAVIFSGTLYAGHTKLFESKHGLSVIFGNAPAIDVVVNGHDIGSPSTAGSVLSGSITPDSSTINTA